MSAASRCFFRHQIKITLIVLTQNGTLYIRSCIDGNAHHRTCLAQVPFLAAILSVSMASSSGDGIPAQLAALLGHPVKRIRITDETPPRISVNDVATAITCKHVRNATGDVLFVQEKHPDVFQKLRHFCFPGQGQRSTRATCATGLIGAWQMQGKSETRQEIVFFPN